MGGAFESTRGGGGGGGNEQVDFAAWSVRQLNQSPLGDDDVRKEIIFPKSGNVARLGQGLEKRHK